MLRNRTSRNARKIMTEYSEYDWKQQLNLVFCPDITKWQFPEIRQVLSAISKGDAINYAKELYFDSLKSESKENLFKSIVIIDIATGALKDLDFSQISRTFLEKIEKYFQAIHL